MADSPSEDGATLRRRPDAWLLVVMHAGWLLLDVVIAASGWRHRNPAVMDTFVQRAGPFGYWTDYNDAARRTADLLNHLWISMLVGSAVCFFVVAVRGRFGGGIPSSRLAIAGLVTFGQLIFTSGGYLGLVEEQPVDMLTHFVVGSTPAAVLALLGGWNALRATARPLVPTLGDRVRNELSEAATTLFRSSPRAG